MLEPENNFPNCLVPYNPAEVISVTAAAAFASRSERTIQQWANERGIGRRIDGGKWAISMPALLMRMESNFDALRLYLNGDRSGIVGDYFARCNIPTKPDYSVFRSAKSAKSAGTV